ncbi:hypothetical protein G7K_2245-t1 [Saitoella complicata NRRL Y-17804]|uniref:Uncharacterized protein n=1 Tax=Saitoella complicata (strain BCRC 22490 / CBS 7301 / JCM 7358 / NBRC 10748 / NRRL Y-17804) TaxID=698492 RepID=A0A0E9NDX5_SAICN|nr:hypothetical protein G7K_2245-t1 [Saitoella complicata NRRL Y-17804]
MDAGYTDPYGFLDLAALARLRRAFLFFTNVASGFRMSEYHLFTELVSMSMRSSMQMEQNALFGAHPVDAGTQTHPEAKHDNFQRAPGGGSQDAGGAEQAPPPAPPPAPAPNGGEERGGGAADESAADHGSDSGTESSSTMTNTPTPRSRPGEGATDEVLHNHRDGQVKKKKSSAGKARRARHTESEKLKKADMGSHLLVIMILLVRSRQSQCISFLLDLFSIAMRKESKSLRFTLLSFTYMKNSRPCCDKMP